MNAIIFVVDSTDRIRMCVAKAELEEVLRNNEVGYTTACVVEREDRSLVTPDLRYDDHYREGSGEGGIK